MPDDQSLPRLPIARNPPKGEVLAATGNEVSANNNVVGMACLAAPPRDVGRMLDHYDTALPHYLDVHRWRDIQGSHQRWPLLRAGHAKVPGGRS